MSLFNQGPPNYVNPPSRGWEIETAALTTIIVALVCVIARMYTKICITRTYGWDDCKPIVTFSQLQ